MRNPDPIIAALALPALFFFFISCQPNPPGQMKSVDTILYNATVAPISGSPIDSGAVAISDGKILAVGTTKEILERHDHDHVEKINCEGKFLMPGFIEGHGHFQKLGLNLIQLDLLQTKSWEEVVDSVASRVQKAKPGDWIIGRGWHQEKWNTPVTPNVQGYPYHDMLSRVSPDHPVMLNHASGHSIAVNAKAMQISGITRETPAPVGGHIVRDAEGNAIGIFEETATNLIENVYKHYRTSMTSQQRDAEWNEAVVLAQQHCHAHGITSFQDAGSTIKEMFQYDSLAKANQLNIRLWVMIYDSLKTIQSHVGQLPIIRSGHDQFTCHAVKQYIDGALGSFGAWLLEPYADRPGFVGQNITPVEDIAAYAEVSAKHHLQFCVHAIGDKGNRVALDIFEEKLKAQPNQDARWRIEHAQHIDPADIPRFKELGVIASMQAMHCTSDAPWVEKRLGKQRARDGAYPWRTLLDAGVVIANGTDAPVERVDPIANFYASVTRRRPDNGLEFYPEQCMTREEALHSLTLSNAFAAREEDIKGSIEPGKWADLVLLSENILTCPEDQILQTKILLTLVGGEIQYKLN